LLRWRVGSARVKKRTFDLVASIIFLIVLSPLYLLLALLVKLDGGPAISARHAWAASAMSSKCSSSAQCTGCRS